MRSLLFLFFFILGLFISTCSQADIVVRGHWKNTDRKEIGLGVLEDAVIYKDTIVTSEIDSLTGSFYFNLPIDHPIKLDLLNQFFLALPNDTISILIDNNQEGKAIISIVDPIEKEQSFFPLLNAAIKPFAISRFSFEKTSSINEYKRDVTAHYNAVIDFMKAHSSHYTSYGKSLIEALIKLDYYNNLIYPISSRKILKKQLPPGYFGELDFSLLSNDDLFVFREYVLFLGYLNEYYYGTPPPKGKNFDSAFVNNRINSAKANFLGTVRDNLLLFIYNGLINRGTTENGSQVNELYRLVSIAFKNNPIRLKQIDAMKRHFDILGRPLPEAILSLQLKSSRGKTVLLSEVLPKQKIIYIDFWASWCGTRHPLRRCCHTKGQMWRWLYLSSLA